MNILSKETPGLHSDKQNTILDQGCANFPRIQEHLNILDGKMVTKSKFRTEDP
jgi:hypothetical protein